jgi:hypothetical protein
MCSAPCRLITPCKHAPMHPHTCGSAAGVKEGWKQAWALMVRELAPQDKSGSYVRQSYKFTFDPAEIKVDRSSRHESVSMHLSASLIHPQPFTQQPSISPAPGACFAERARALPLLPRERLPLVPPRAAGVRLAGLCARDAVLHSARVRPHQGPEGRLDLQQGGAGPSVGRAGPLVGGGEGSGEVEGMEGGM